MQTSPLASSHVKLALCKEGKLRKLQWGAAVDSVLAIQQHFSAYGEELLNVEVFQYLGLLLSNADNDSQAVCDSMKKARRCWARISRLLSAENTPS